MNSKIKSLIDPEILEALEALPPALSSGIKNEDNYQSLREVMSYPETTVFEHPEVDMEEKTITHNGRTFRAFIYKPKDMSVHSGGGLVWIHGGGNVAGTAREDDRAIDFVVNLKLTMVSIEYKLAPEHQHPEGMEDCYAGLLWTSENAVALGIDSKKIAIGGESAGGGMVARTVLLNRERKGTNIAFQLLKCPMLDNTHDTTSGQLTGYPIWDRSSSLWGWEVYLGKDYGKNADQFQSPARAEDLSGLPPTYVYVGAVELFRDECIAYAQKLMKDGVPTELLVVPGLPHGGEILAPATKISEVVYSSVRSALKRGLDI